MCYYSCGYMIFIVHATTQNNVFASAPLISIVRARKLTSPTHTLWIATTNATPALLAKTTRQGEKKFKTKTTNTKRHYVILSGRLPVIESVNPCLPSPGSEYGARTQSFPGIANQCSGNCAAHNPTYKRPDLDKFYVHLERSRCVFDSCVMLWLYLARCVSTTLRLFHRVSIGSLAATHVRVR